MAKPDPLSAQSLYRPCLEEDLQFQTTDDIESADIIIGQERAYSALQLGLQIDNTGYNLYALGPPGTGKKTAIREIVTRIAAGKNPARDWCYVNNFDESHKPVALSFPGGGGIRFKREMEKLIEELRIVVPATFESDEYRSRVEEIEEEFREKQSEPLNKLNEEAKARGIALIKTPTGFAFAPLTGAGEVMPPDEFNKLEEKEREKIQEIITELQEKLKGILTQFPAQMKEAREKFNALNREVAMTSIDPLFEALKQSYGDRSEVLAYINAVEKDVLENIHDFHVQSEESLPSLFPQTGKGESLQRYKVNLIVDNSDRESAPVVFEDLPNHANLIGRSEYQAHMGALVTDFTLIKPGALHRANGGYLILNIQKVLMQPYAWESLKRALETREIRIESLERTLSIISTLSLEPEPIPLDVKVVLVGDRLPYYLLHQYDPDFPDLFKIAADFDDIMDRNRENVMLYAGMITNMVRTGELRPLDRQAVARIIEHSSRLAGDSEKLSTNMRSMNDLLTEADFLCRQAGGNIITPDTVQTAIDNHIHRNDRIRQRINEEILRGSLLIDSQGTSVGQINGLSVMDLGGFSFGSPTRITATMRLGEGEVIDIERETELGGAIHSKGVLIISSFLASRYSPCYPFSITASIVFEQSYGGIEGDSASVAELCALLSAIAGLPVSQSLAVTGSVNQHGKVQPIGGVNEKIEGFYDVCRHRGLTGEQGVIIPRINVKNLMLRRDVVESAEKGEFHIYPVETIDEALEMLLNTPAGIRDSQGRYPEDSINARVEKQLQEFADIRQEYSSGKKGQLKP
ncbi:MAG: ATP-binding protein [Gammaproteobacteria bacterium]|jgi:lon-related putative ATP-dependent protease